MRIYQKNFILVGIIIYISFFCVYSFNLVNYDINRTELNQRTNLKLSQIENIELTLNTELGNQGIGGFPKRYYVFVPEGNIHIKVTWDDFWDMDLDLNVYSDQNYFNLIASSDNPGNEHEIIDLNIEQEMTIYIRIWANSGSGFFNIVVHDDTYISPQIILTVTVITIIVIVIGVVIGLLVYFKRRGKEIQTFITSELKPYPAKMEEEIQPKSDDDEETNIFICPDCGHENLKSYKKCKFCGKKLNLV